MPYADPDKAREYQRKWEARKRASLTPVELDAKRAQVAAAMRGRDKRERAKNPEVWRQREREKYRRETNGIQTDKKFLAYDGEAIDGKYVLLANTREYIVNMDGLSSEEALEFLTREYDDNPWRVIFASDYDVTMVLRDLPMDKLEQLAHTSKTSWNGYNIAHYPGKIFRLSRKGLRRQVVYFDVWGFFQKSFLNTVDEYRKTGLYLSPEDTECLEWGKAARVAFESSDLERCIRYNNIECTLLEAIMYRLRGAVNSAGMRPTMWHGPGVLAEIFLDRARSRRWVEKGFQNVALRRAYFGGRIEVLQRGVIAGPVYDYDIHSAYPYALASFRVSQGDFFDTTEYVAGVVGLYSVVWNVGDARIPAYGERADWRTVNVGPFPYREHDGSIHFPPQGRGIYHAVEVDSAIAAYGLANAPGEPGIYVERGRISEPGERPFRTIVEQWYEKREEYKRRGDITQVAYKLGLNSAYGKLAQRVGRRKHGDMYLAGFITAYTRAMLLRAAASEGGEGIIAFATDGILARNPLPLLPISEALGDFEYAEYDGVDVLMSGIYRLHKGDEQYSVKSRGWSQLDFDEAMTALDTRLSPVGFEVRNHAFVSYRMAVHSPNAYGPLRGQFIDRYRYLSPETEQKRLWSMDGVFGASWMLAAQGSVARPLERDGEALALSDIVASAPLVDSNAPSEDIWIVGKPDAENAFLLDADGLPLEVA